MNIAALIDRCSLYAEKCTDAPFIRTPPKPCKGSKELTLTYCNKRMVMLSPTTGG
jgi:hypothetical protein